ncbi:MAG: NTP transferase domain-containing protein [Gemmatimonadetes bacterium]|nr:NTP transferase domain-containing protein [Gemmatimonadota bacterium]
MLLAAGEGRRLRPLTADLPKALVDVGGTPLLERVARSAIAAGATRLVINAHYRAEQIVGFLDERAGFGVEYVVSREDEASEAPLETGGALVHARPLLDRAGAFLLHNADIVTDLDLRALYAAHVEGEASDGRLATLVVGERETTRPLLVDETGVCGRANRTEGWEVIARHPAAGVDPTPVGFAGIHVASSRLPDLLTERGAFSLIDAYMRLIGEGHVVAAYDAGDALWHDVGTIEKLEAARAAVEASEAIA